MNGPAAESSGAQLSAPDQERIRKRHTIAALVYFLYGLVYLFGAQYLTSMQTAARGMENATAFFVLGGILTVLFPVLLQQRFALGLSLWRQRQGVRKTLFVDFALLLGLAVSLRVIALVRYNLYTKSPLHTAAFIVAAINAACLWWAGLSQPVWISGTRHEVS